LEFEKIITPVVEIAIYIYIASWAIWAYIRWAFIYLTPPFKLKVEVEDLKH
jgi:hypothetical protein